MRRTAPGPRTALLLAIALRLVAPATAQADDDPLPVLLVAGDPEERLVREVRLELGSLRATVLVLAATDPAAVDPASSRLRARVLLRLTQTHDGVEVWVRDREDAPFRLAELVGDPTGAANVSVIAIRTTEVVHAALLSPLPSPPALDAPRAAWGAAPAPAASAPDAEVPASGSRSEVTKPVAVRSPGEITKPVAAGSRSDVAKPVGARSPGDAAKPVAPSTFAVRAGAGTWLGPGGVAPLGSAALGGSWRFAERLSAEADLRIPVVLAHVGGPEGNATIAVTALAAAASVALTPATAPVRPAIGAGVAFAWTHAEGQAVAPFMSTHADVFCAIPFLRVSTGLPLADRFSLRADLLGGLGLPAQAIRFAGRRAAIFGAPLAEVSLSLEAAWR